MSTSEGTVDRRSGLANVVDIVVAPNAAFDRLRVVPIWGWAFLVTVVLGIAGVLVATPASLHAIDTAMPAQLAANPNIAKLPPDQQQKQIAATVGFVKIATQFTWVLLPIVVLLIGVVQALILTFANAIGGGDGSFKKYFALSITTAVVGTGLGSVVIGIIVLVRGVNSFETLSSVQQSLPSLALLAPGVKGFVGGFLGAMNVFYLWAAALLALGTIRIGRVKPAAAWIAAIVILLITGCFAGFGAAQNNG
jgi:hypothetical protein